MAKRNKMWALAGLLIGRYGRRAGAKAEAYADKAARDGDGEAKAIWTDTVRILEKSDRRETPPK